MIKRIITLTVILCLITSTLYIPVNAIYEPFSHTYFDYENGSSFFGGSDAVIADPGGDASRGKVGMMPDAFTTARNFMTVSESAMNKIHIGFDFRAEDTSSSFEIRLRGKDVAGGVKEVGKLLYLVDGKISSRFGISETSVSADKWYRTEITIDFTGKKISTTVKDETGVSVADADSQEFSYGDIEVGRITHARGYFGGIVYVDNLSFNGDEKISITSKEYVVSNENYTVSEVPSNMEADVFLYYIRRDNPDYEFRVVTKTDCSEVDHNTPVSSKHYLKVISPTGSTELYNIVNNNKNYIEDDFEGYYTGEFSTNGIWSCNELDNDEIVYEDGNRVYKHTLAPGVSEYISCPDRTYLGNVEIKFRARNTKPSSGNTVISLISRVDGVTKQKVLFYIKSNITAFSSSGTIMSGYDGNWADFKVTINDYGDGNSVRLVASVNNSYTKSTAFTKEGFDWNDFSIRITSSNSSSATENMEFYLDDFSYKSGYTEPDGVECGDVKIYNEDNYTGGILTGDNKFKIKIKNNGAGNENILIIATEKEGNYLEEIDVVDVELSAGEEGYAETSINISDIEDIANNDVEFYIWRSDDIFPLREIYKVDSTNTAKAIAKGHPRIIADKSTFERIAGYTDSTRVSWRNNVMSQADAIVSNLTTTNSSSSYYIGTTNVGMLEMARRVKAFAEVLGMAYQLTGEQKYATAVRDMLYAAGAFDNWNPSHALDFAEMIAAFSIGYDWCYDGLTQAERDDIASFVYEKGLKISQREYDDTRPGRNKWYNTDTNWSAVCNGGSIIGALAFAEYDPVNYDRIINQGTYFLKGFLSQFAPDGAWEEGHAYLGYSLQYLTQLSDSLINVRGDDVGIRDTAGLEASADFIMETMGPLGNHTFSDQSLSKHSCPELFWIAEFYDRPDVRGYALEKVALGSGNANNCLDALIWCKSINDVEDYVPQSAFNRVIENVVFNKGTGDNRTWLSTIGGYNNMNHHHMDVGSFVFDHNGVRWATELGGDNYDSEGYYEKKAYRTRAEGHNTLVIKPSINVDQKLDAVARVVSGNLEADEPYAIYDLTSAYDATMVKRGFKLVDGGMVVRDEITTAGTDDLVYWFMHMDSNITVKVSDDQKSATLEKDGKKMVVKLYDDGEISYVKARPLPEIGEYSSAVYSDAASYPNPSGTSTNGLHRKLMIKTKGSGSITVSITESGKELTSAEAAASLAQWIK